jgi:ABC-type proline/glycine betaine transport system permease subunit
MSLRAIPLIAIAFIFYNLIALTGQDLQKVLFSIKMVSGGVWEFRWSDLILFLTFILLFVEILKSTYTSTSSLVDHGLSMLVLMACLVEFLLVSKAATSTFFLILTATLIDVVAGYTIGIRVAKRDVSFGSQDN